MTTSTRRWERLSKRWDHTFRWALVASLLFHAIVVLFFRQHPVVPVVAPTSAAGPDANDDRAARGGGMQVIALQIVAPPPVAADVPKPPVPVLVPTPTAVVVKPPQQSVTVPAPLPGVAVSPGEGKGPATGPGTETGTGRGDGGTGESGLGNRVTPPSPRGLILPPSDRPAKVRGKEIAVYVFVTERGIVQPDSTRLAPGSGDQKFDDRLKKQAAEWVFNPARRDGRPTAGWFQYAITL
jgi:hypothetical protein